MEVISFLIGVFLGVISLSMSRIILLFKVILSIGTSYIIFMIIHPNFKIWNLDNLKWKNIFYDFQYKGECIFTFFISLSIFYLIFPAILNLLFSHKFKNRYNSFVFNLEDSRAKPLKYFCHKLAKKTIQIRTKLGFGYKKGTQINDRSDIMEYWHDLIQIGTFIVHFSICWVIILGFPSMIYCVSMILIELILLLNIFLVPFCKNLFYYFDNVFNHELNRYFKSVS